MTKKLKPIGLSILALMAAYLLGWLDSTGPSPNVHGQSIPMSSQLGDFAITRTNNTTLTIGAACSSITPCNARFGQQVYSIISPGVVTISGTLSGADVIYISRPGKITIGDSLGATCSGCIIAPGVTSFPPNASIPIATWTAANGTWDLTGQDNRAYLSAFIMTGQSGVVVTQTPNEINIGEDNATIPTYMTASASLAFPAIPAGTCSADLTFSLPGANPGDAVEPGWPAALPAGANGSMRINAPGVVSVRLCADVTGILAASGFTYTATVVRGF